MVPSSGTPVRTDHLRALNRPVGVVVELDERELPVVVIEDRDVAVGRFGGRAVAPHPSLTQAVGRYGSSSIPLTPPGGPAVGTQSNGTYRPGGGEGLGGTAGRGEAEGRDRQGGAGVAGRDRRGWVRSGVESVVEIWRVDDEWWRQPIHRRYVEVVLEGGAHVVLFEDETTQQWYVQKP